MMFRSCSEFNEACKCRPVSLCASNPAGLLKSEDYIPEKFFKGVTLVSLAESTDYIRTRIIITELFELFNNAVQEPEVM